MVDLERREVVDVLSERSAEATARWLSQHTKVEIVSRDRCGLYADGNRRGAPQARQVADRFHLIQNLRQTIEQQLSRALRPPDGPAATRCRCQGSGRRSCAAATDCSRNWQSIGSFLEKAAVPCGRTCLTGVKILQVAGNGIRAIVRETGFNWRTVTKWAGLGELTEQNVMAAKPTTPGNFQNHLSRRWAEGCATGPGFAAGDQMSRLYRQPVPSRAPAEPMAPRRPPRWN